MQAKAKIDIGGAALPVVDLGEQISSDPQPGVAALIAGEDLERNFVGVDAHHRVEQIIQLVVVLIDVLEKRPPGGIVRPQPARAGGVQLVETQLQGFDLVTDGFFFDAKVGQEQLVLTRQPGKKRLPVTRPVTVIADHHVVQRRQRLA